MVDLFLIFTYLYPKYLLKASFYSGDLMLRMWGKKKLEGSQTLKERFGGWSVGFFFFFSHLVAAQQDVNTYDHVLMLRGKCYHMLPIFIMSRHTAVSFIWSHELQYSLYFKLSFYIKMLDSVSPACLLLCLCYVLPVWCWTGSVWWVFRVFVFLLKTYSCYKWKWG